MKSNGGDVVNVNFWGVYAGGGAGGSVLITTNILEGNGDIQVLSINLNIFCKET